MGLPSTIPASLGVDRSLTWKTGHRLAGGLGIAVPQTTTAISGKLVYACRRICGGWDRDSVFNARDSVVGAGSMHRKAIVLAVICVTLILANCSSPLRGERYSRTVVSPNILSTRRTNPRCQPTWNSSRVSPPTPRCRTFTSSFKSAIERKSRLPEPDRPYWIHSVFCRLWYPPGARRRFFRKRPPAARNLHRSTPVRPPGLHLLHRPSRRGRHHTGNGSRPVRLR